MSHDEFSYLPHEGCATLPNRRIRIPSSQSVLSSKSSTGRTSTSSFDKGQSSHMTTCPHGHFRCEVCQMYVFIEASEFIICCEIMLHAEYCIILMMLKFYYFVRKQFVYMTACSVEGILSSLITNGTCILRLT